MSCVVALVIESCPNWIEAARVVRDVTGNPYARIRRTISERTPVYERELFLNDYVVVADDFRKLLSALHALGARITITEDGTPIAPDVLLNVLASSAEFR